MEALPNYEDMLDRGAGLKLLSTIQSLMFNIQDEKDKLLSVHLAKWQFYLFKQEKTVTVADYYEQFNNLIKDFEACGASISKDDGIM